MRAPKPLSRGSQAGGKAWGSGTGKRGDASRSGKRKGQPCPQRLDSGVRAAEQILQILHGLLEMRLVRAQRAGEKAFLLFEQDGETAAGALQGPSLIVLFRLIAEVI